MLRHDVFLDAVAFFHFSPCIDLFANADHHQLVHWCGPGSPIAEDSLLLDWYGLAAWINPPWPLIGAAISKIANTKMRALMVVPWWPHADWFPMFLDVFVAYRKYNGNLFLDNAGLLRPRPSWDIGIAVL